MLKIKIKRLATAGGRVPQLPHYATPGSAAVDLAANLDEGIEVQPGERVLVPTGLALELPQEKYGAFVFARSGLSTRQGLALANGVGVIDSDYRGEIAVAMINLSERPQRIEPGERIAQMAILPVKQAMFLDSESLSDTSRGQGGFGSTGK